MTNIIIKSKIKNIINEIDKDSIINNISSEVSDALEEKVKEILKNAINRAKANQRKTLFPRDL